MRLPAFYIKKGTVKQPFLSAGMIYCRYIWLHTLLPASEKSASPIKQIQDWQKFVTDIF